MNISSKLCPVRGFKDYIGSSARLFELIEDICKKTCKKYGYKPIYTPIVEPLLLFTRAVGKETDIIDKEIFYLNYDKEKLVLRPEQTSSILRCALNENLSEGRFFCSGSMFRHERPQEGRLRQFQQFSCECIGYDSLYADCDIIMLSLEILQTIEKELNIKIDYELEINSIGSAMERKEFIEYLQAYLKPKAHLLTEDSQRRLLKNPLRVFDSKDENDQTILKECKTIEHFLSEATNTKFEQLKTFLDDELIAYTHNKTLVRGLDYYNDLVFEFKAKDMTKAAIIAGGHYDYLAPKINSKKQMLPAVGFSLGIDRLINIIMKNNNIEDNKTLPLFVLDASINYVKKAVDFMRQKDCVIVIDHCKNLSEALSFVTKNNNCFLQSLVIIGKTEEDNNVVCIKDLNSREQYCLALPQNSREVE